MIIGRRSGNFNIRGIGDTAVIGTRARVLCLITISTTAIIGARSFVIYDLLLGKL
jgi:serine acetyltransferase